MGMMWPKVGKIENNDHYDIDYFENYKWIQQIYKLISMFPKMVLVLFYFLFKENNVIFF